MSQVWWAVVVVVALLAIDRLACWAEARGWMYWRTRRASPSGGAGVLGELMTALQPGRQIVQEERDRRRMLRDDSRAGAPGDAGSWVDLDGGEAFIAVDPTSPSAAADHAATGRPAG